MEFIKVAADFPTVESKNVNKIGIFVEKRKNFQLLEVIFLGFIYQSFFKSSNCVVDNNS